MSNGKGDKWRGGWTTKYSDNYKKIFKKKKDNKMKLDKCVMCGKKTRYGEDVPIELRENYIEGAGQMCTDCHTRIYGAK